MSNDELIALLKECRFAIDELINTRPAMAGLICGSTTLGNLKASLHDFRIEPVKQEAPQPEPVGWMTDVELDELHRGIAEEAYVYRNADAASIIPLYTAPPAPAIPQGWKLVPVEPTLEMQDAWDNAPNCNNEDDSINMCNAYRAMLAAAPTP